jgi:hypothetical protein
MPSSNRASAGQWLKGTGSHPGERLPGSGLPFLDTLRQR